MKRKVELIITKANVYNSFLKKFEKKDISVDGGKIYFMGKNLTEQFEAETILEASGKYVVPGFIDAHMHIESSMITPMAFSNTVRKHGVTTLVAEPHEMANVMGYRGITDMIASASDSSVDIFYGIPSSVPTKSANIETSGGRIGYYEMIKLHRSRKVVCVGEVMNYREIIKKDNLTIQKFIKYLKKNDPAFPIEGHCPALVDEDLSRFLFWGINSDHTEHSLEEFRQRFESGMYMELQEKSLSKELIDYIIENKMFERFGFVTDDVMPDSFIEKGHLDHVIRKAVKLGLPVEAAIYNATYTNARRMRLFDRGALAPSLLADFSFIGDLTKFNIEKTFKNGKCIYDCEKPEIEPSEYKFPSSYYSTVKVNNIKKEDFVLTHQTVCNGTVEVRVIEVSDGSTKTKEKRVKLKVINHEIQYRDEGLMLISVYERYGKTGGHSLALVTGDCIKQGAVATTYAHDSHNLLVVGDTPENMYTAAKAVIAVNGGIATADNGCMTSILPLPIGGIISDKSCLETAAKMKEVRMELKKQGYFHYNEIMSLCTLALPVSPCLKITDKGLFNVSENKLCKVVL